MQDFTPKPGDELKEVFYPGGTINERWYLRNGIPANGWSRTMFFPDGKLKEEHCFSHNILIEQRIYDQTGKKISHKKYNNRTKVMDEAKEPKKIPRPNIVSGCHHMGFYYYALPYISKFIGAEYSAQYLTEVFETFKQKVEKFEADEVVGPGGVDEEEACTHYFYLEGKEMKFSIKFERHEGYFFWHLNTPDEESYAKAKEFMSQLEIEFADFLEN